MSGLHGLKKSLVSIRIVNYANDMLYDWRDILLTIVGAICFAMIIVAFASCKTQTKVVTITETRDSIRTEYKTDSIYIYNRDSVFVREKNDTITIERFKILFRDRFKVDTITISREVEKPVVTEVEVPTRYIPRWVWWLLGINIVAVVGLIARIAWKFYGGRKIK